MLVIMLHAQERSNPKQDATVMHRTLPVHHVPAKKVGTCRMLAALLADASMDSEG